MAGLVKRILVYTHNSIGLGHAFRTLAVVTGVKRCRPDIDILVVSSSSIPQIFFDHGIEVIKLPSVKLDIDSPDDQMKPRYLRDFDLESIFDFRQRIILETFDFFKPDALIIEHNMTGQMSELIPLLMKKWMRQGGPADFTLVHMCRGIMKWIPLLRIPYQNPRHRSESINIGELYDMMYVLEDRDVIDINKEFLGDDPALEPKIHYLGKITNKNYDELSPRRDVLEKYALADRRTILVLLGRNEKAPALTRKLLDTFERSGLNREYQVISVVDPYLEERSANELFSLASSDGVRFMPFTPDLVDLINQADLVVSRVGYNTVNEILLTGAKALLIPEHHGSGEQEQRVRSLPRDNIRVLTEDEALNNGMDAELRDLLQSEETRPPFKFDKYEVGRRIIEDLEAWHRRKKRPDTA